MGEKEELCKLNLKESDKLQPLLEDVGQQLSLVFNNEGSALAAGGEVDIVFHILWTYLLHDIEMLDNN